MPPYRYSSGISYTLGPGPASSAIKTIIWVNIAAFVLTSLNRLLTVYLGLTPAAVIEEFWIWQPVTYMFLHGGLFHILFNMLALWMFGVELERIWGTKFFVTYYFVTGLGAAFTTIALALMPVGFADRMYYSVTIGASGAIYGLLLAYGMYFPDRPIYMYLLFPIPAKYFVMIMGGVAFLSSINDTGSGIAHAAHLGGLVVGYVYLTGRRRGLLPEIRYQYARWKMNRARRKFGVYSGRDGDGWGGRVH